jgi:hypothetical protein
VIFRPNSVLAIMFGIAVSAAAEAQPVDRCSDILKHGVFNTSSLNTDRVEYRYVQQSIDQHSTEGNTTSFTSNFSYLTPTEQYAGIWNASNDQQKMDMLRQTRLEETFTRDSLRSFVSKASEALTDAWKSCMERRGKGPIFSARYSADRRFVILEASSGIEDLNLAFNKKENLALNDKTRWRHHIDLLPPNALTCESGFSTKRTRDSINCRRSDDSLNQEVQVTLRAKHGEQPTLILPGPPAPLPPPPPAIQQNVYLSKELESGAHNFRGIEYRQFVSANATPYPHGVVMASQDTVASAVTYKIPWGAKTFAGSVVSTNPTCDNSGNGWSVTIKTPSGIVTYHLSQHQLDPMTFELPVDAIPFGAPRELSISVDPKGNRTCDHSALGDPHFKPFPPAMN